MLIIVSVSRLTKTVAFIPGLHPRILYREQVYTCALILTDVNEVA